MNDTYAIQPPVYFPDLTYCALMSSVDCFVVGENFQYSRQSFQNRAHVRSPDGAQWLTVPLIGGQHGLPISKTQIDYAFHWQAKHLKALRFNYGSTPFYKHYIDQVSRVIVTEHDSLAALTVASVALVHELLGLGCALENKGFNGFRERRSTSRTQHLFDSDIKRNNSNESDRRILSYKHPVYRQNFDGFVDGMSVLDLLFSHGPEAPRILRSGISFGEVAD